MRKEKGDMKIKIQDIFTKVHGLRAFPMEKESKFIRKVSLFKEKSCMGKNLGRAFIISLTEKYTMVVSTTTKAMEKVKLPTLIKAFMKETGN